MKKSKDDIQEEALQAVLPHDRCGAAITMGGGKTRLGLRHMVEMEKLSLYRYLVVAPKKRIFKEWQSEAHETAVEHLMQGTTFSTYLSMPKLNQDDYDVIYFDEAHSLIEESHDEWLGNFKGRVLGLTGTKPVGKHSPKARMVNKYCPIVYEYTTDEGVGDGILNDYRIIVHTIPMSSVMDMPMENKKTGGKWMTSEKKSYEYWSERINDPGATNLERLRISRMRAMMDFPSKEIYTQKLLRTIADKCIIFANTAAQADKLCSHSYHTKNKNSEVNFAAFCDGQISTLSCVLQLSEGVNIPYLRQGIILHAYGNERKTAQRIGRLLRLNPEDVCTAHILCFKDTIDERWVKQALAYFDQTKITWKDVK